MRNFYDLWVGFTALASLLFAFVGSIVFVLWACVKHEQAKQKFYKNLDKMREKHGKR